MITEEKSGTSASGSFQARDVNSFLINQTNSKENSDDTDLQNPKAKFSSKFTDESRKGLPLEQYLDHNIQIEPGSKNFHREIFRF